MTTEQKIQIKIIIANVLNRGAEFISVTDISEDKNLFTDLGIDSLDFVEILMKIEKDFNTSIDEVDFYEVKTFDDLCNVTNKYV